MFTPDQLCLQIWILMSFQETLVSKKQKKTKKILKMHKNQNLQKKQRLLPSASLSLSQQQNEIKIYHKNILKWKTVKFLNFPFSWLQFNSNATSLRKWSNEHDISMKNYENTKNYNYLSEWLQIWLNDKFS